MDREYVISKRSKIGYYTLLAIFFTLAVVLFFVAANNKNATPLYFLVIFFGIFPPLLLSNVIKKKITISGDYIRCIGIFSTNEMALRDIKGYRILVNKSSRSIVFESNNGDRKVTISSATDLTDKDELFNWVQTNFADLDAIDVQHEKDEVLHNTLLGATEEERENSLKKAKNLTVAFAVLAGVIGFMNIFYDSKIWAVADVAYPFLGVVLIVTSKGLIKFVANSKRSVYPHIAVGMMILALACAFSGASAGELYDSANLWKPAIILTLIIAGALYLAGTNKSMAVGWQIFIIIICAGFFGFGDTMHINSVFDDSQPQVYHAQVNNKTITSGKHTSYDLHISPWGPGNKSVTIDVGRRFYGSVNVGDSVSMYYKQGALNIPWYRIAH